MFYLMIAVILIKCVKKLIVGAHTFKIMLAGFDQEPDAFDLTQRCMFLNDFFTRKGYLIIE